MANLRLASQRSPLPITCTEVLTTILYYVHRAFGSSVWMYLQNQLRRNMSRVRYTGARRTIIGHLLRCLLDFNIGSSVHCLPCVQISKVSWITVTSESEGLFLCTNPRLDRLWKQGSGRWWTWRAGGTSGAPSLPKPSLPSRRGESESETISSCRCSGDWYSQSCCCNAVTYWYIFK